MIEVMSSPSAPPDIQVVYDSKQEEMENFRLAQQLILEQQREMERAPRRPHFVIPVPPLIENAETVQTLNDMMNLKEELILYLRLHSDVTNGHFPDEVPFFYHASLYWLYLKTIHSGQRCIYIPFLGNVIQQRLHELMPSSRGKVNIPAFQDTLSLFSHFHTNMLSKTPTLAANVDQMYNRLLGEAYQFFHYHYHVYKNPPARGCNFLLNGLIVFYYCGFHQIGNEQIKRDSIPRLKRNLTCFSPRLFDNAQEFLVKQLNSLDIQMSNNRRRQ